MKRKTEISAVILPQVKNENNSIHVAYVYGGLSTEREVSLMAFKGISNALHELGYKVTPVDMGYDFAEVINTIKPDVVFNGLYGTYGEDGCVPGTLEILGIKYTHSGVLASSMGFNKEASYKIFDYCGIKSATRKIINKEDNIKTDPMERPYVIKPISEGSSVGVIVVFREDEFDFSKYEWKYGDRIFVEKYIPGKEIQVAVFKDKGIGAIELVPLKRRFYDYDSKYQDGMTKHIMPAPISEEVLGKLLDFSQKAHTALGCKTLSRVDFRYNPEEGLDGCYILEINTHPGMTPLSLIPEICQHSGISYNEIVNQLVQDAIKL